LNSRISIPDDHRLPYVAQAFGLRWASDHPLDQFAPAAGPGGHDVEVRRVKALPDRPGGVVVNNGRVFADGARFNFGDIIFDTFGENRVDWCGPSTGQAPFAFYGTVAAIILAWRGFVLLHGSAVAVGEQTVLVVGPPGAGKSTLCHALVQRGGRLVSDDLTALMPMTQPGVPMLQPGRPAIRLAAGHGDPGAEKVLHMAPLVDPGRPVPLTAMVMLREQPHLPGLAEASEALRGQLFRPQWMRVLPFRRERSVTLLHAAPRISIFTAPRASDHPEIPVEEKAGMVLDRLREFDIIRAST